MKALEQRLEYVTTVSARCAFEDENVKSGGEEKQMEVQSQDNCIVRLLQVRDSRGKTEPADSSIRRALSVGADDVDGGEVLKGRWIVLL